VSYARESKPEIQNANGRQNPSRFKCPFDSKTGYSTCIKERFTSLKFDYDYNLSDFGATGYTSNVRFNPMGRNLNALHPTNAVGAAANVAGATLYVFGLRETHSELTLYELFSPFGGILNVKLIRDLSKEDKPCKGYGFVNYTNCEDAVKAVAAMNGVTFEERNLQVSIKQNKSHAIVP